MDSNETWNKEGQTLITPGQYVIVELVQNIKGLSVVLENDEYILEVFFDGIPVLIQNSIEGIRMRTWATIQDINGDKEFFRNWFLFKVFNSKLIEWIVDESCGFYSKESLNHYSIVTGEELVDIVATFKPIIKVNSHN